VNDGQTEKGKQQTTGLEQKRGECGGDKGREAEGDEEKGRGYDRREGQTGKKIGEEGEEEKRR
jgi:hypothetical protein